MTIIDDVMKDAWNFTVKAYRKEWLLYLLVGLIVMFITIMISKG